MLETGGETGNSAAFWLPQFRIRIIQREAGWENEEALGWHMTNVPTAGNEDIG